MNAQRLSLTGRLSQGRRSFRTWLISSISLGLLTLTLSSPLNAQECSVSHDILQGDPAPCHGVLWPNDATEEAIKLKAVVLPKLRVDLEHLQELSVLEKKNHVELMAVCQGELRDTRGLLTQAMGLSATPWYKEPLFVAGSAFVVGVVTTVLVARSL